MSAGTLISVEEYLNTSYDPDVEYVDGVLVERNVGKWLHSLVQRNIILALGRDYPDRARQPTGARSTRDFSTDRSSASCRSRSRTAPTCSSSCAGTPTTSSPSPERF